MKQNCQLCSKPTNNQKYCSRDCANKSNARTIKVDLSSNPSPTYLNTLTAHKVNSIIDKVAKDVKLSFGGQLSSEPESIIKEKYRSLPKTISYGTKNLGRRGGTWNKPFHDFGEIARAIDTESYLARSVQKHREYALKEGWYLHGLNPETVAYVKQRLMEFELISDCLVEDWISESMTNHFTYHNFFLALSRDETKTTGRRIRLHGKDISPISAIFPMDPTSIECKQNKSGRVIGWRQKIDMTEVIFDPMDIIHGYMDRKTGFVFGTPYAVPVLDDIRALRRLEELAELVAHKHLFPLFHYQVGTEENPAETIELADGTLIDEVQLAKDAVNNLPGEGGLVTSERHKITLIGSENKVLDIAPYIEHFESRVMGGLRLSGIDLGRGETSNRATAGIVNKNLMEAVKDYQRVFSCVITKKLFNMLLFEGGYNVTEENMVHFKFPPIDREELRAHQTHGLLLFQANTITHDELRTKYLDLEAMSDTEFSDTNYSLFIKPLADIKAAPSPSTSNSASAVSSVAIPENQYGKSVKPSLPKNDITSLASQYYDQLKHTKNIDESKINNTFTNIKQAIDASIHTFTNDIFKSYNKDSVQREVAPQIIDNYKDQAYKLLHGLKDRVIMHLKQSTCNKSVVIDTYSIEFSVIMDRIVNGAKTIATYESYKLSGRNTLDIVNSDKVYTIDLNKYDYYDIMLGIGLENKAHE